MGSSGQSRSSADILRTSHTSAHMLVIVVVVAIAAAAAGRAVEEEERRPPPLPPPMLPGTLRGGALPLARSPAFLARCVAKVCSFAALSAELVSQ